MTGCGSQTALPSTSTGGGQNTATVPATAIVTAADPEASITNMMNAFSTAPPYHTNTALTVKFEIESTAAGVRSHTEQFIQYDPNIKIEAPVQ